MNIDEPASAGGGSGRLGRWVARAWRDNRNFLALLCAIVFFKSAIADLSSISGASMLPTLVDGDKVWVNKLAYDVKVPFTDVSLGRVSDPVRGDIVIIDSSRAGKRLVKRIVGVPGDRIEIQNNALIINGKPVDYEVLSREGGTMIIEEALPGRNHQVRLTRYLMGASSRSHGPVEVPGDRFFVLGDNRNSSADSRVYSFIPRGEIIGRSRSVVFSLDSGNFYLPRGGRFLAGLE